MKSPDIESAIVELFYAFRDVKKPERVVACDRGDCLTEGELKALIETDQHTLTYQELLPYTAFVFSTVG